MDQLNLLESMVPETVPRYAIAVERPVVFLGMLGALDRLPITMLSAQLIVAHQLDLMALYAAECYDTDYSRIHSWWMPTHLQNEQECPAGLIGVIKNMGIVDGALTFQTVINLAKPIAIQSRTNVFELTDLERHQLYQQTTVEQSQHAATTNPSAVIATSG